MARARRRTGGGSATTSGTTFQEEVAIHFAVLILADTEASPPLELSPDTRLVGVYAETPSPVDDIAVDTSAGGRLFIQAKRSPSLSPSATSEFASAISQFVRQFRIGNDAPGQPLRALDAVLDRLVLAVDYTAPDTIRNHLTSVLTKLRTVSGPQDMVRFEGALNQQETSALAKIRTVARAAWRAESGSDIGVTEELALLHLIHVLPLDMRSVGDSVVRCRDHLRRSVVADPDRSEDARNALLAICRTFSPQRTGGDLKILRAELERRGIFLRSTPGFAADITALKAYTVSRLRALALHAEISLAGEVLRIERSVVGDLRSYAIDEDVVVVGEPGAGKSGCMHDLAVALRTSGSDVLLITADMLNAASVETMSRDLGLTGRRNLDEVLSNWTGEGPAYLLIDALDAARASMTISVLCQLVRDVRARAPRWRVIASIREYDLRTSTTIQELFHGQGHPTRCDSRFATVRHIRIERLDDQEIEQLGNTSSRLSAALAVAQPALHALVRNPFNLSLLCALLDQNVAAEELNAVHARFGLLGLYWRHRVETGDVLLRTSVLSVLVDEMVRARTLHLSSLHVGAIAGDRASALHGFLQNGVLVEVASPSVGAPQLVGFAHNILFDFAVARLWLQLMNEEALQRLTDPANDDLVIALHPSITLASEALWDQETDHFLFWSRALTVAEAGQIRLVGKIIAAAVAAEHYATTADIRPLIAQISASRPSVVELMRYTITAAVTRYQSDPNACPFIGPHAQDWLGLASELSDHIDTTAWGMRFLLGQVIGTVDGANLGQLRSANNAAIALVRYGLQDTARLGLVRTGIEVAALTIAVDVDRTTAAISLVLAPEEIARGGHEWLSSLAERLDIVAQSAPALALQIAEAAFAATGSRDEQVPMGGRLLPITFNKHDMFAMARHHVSKLFPKVFLHSPETATRMVVRVMRTVIATKHSQGEQTPVVHGFMFRGQEARFIADGSYIWTEGEHNRHEDWWKILAEFRASLTSLTGDVGRRRLEPVLDVLRDENELAVVWAQVLVAGGEAPESLGAQLVELLASPVILGHLETHVAAGKCLAAVFANVSPESLRSIESAVVQLVTDATDEAHDRAVEQRARLVGCIPVELIEDTALRQIRAELDAAGGAPPNAPIFTFSSEWTRHDEDAWLRGRGGIPPTPASLELRALADEVQALGRTWLNSRPAASDALNALPLFERLHDAIGRGAEAGASAEHVEHATDSLVDTCSKFAHASGLRAQDPATRFLRERLRQSAVASRPVPNPEDDIRWDGDHAIGWSSSPRVDAALGLMRLSAFDETVDADILADVQRLAIDPVPAVRYQVLCHLGWLQQSSPEVMWRLIDYASREEPRTGILTHYASNVLLWMQVDQEGRLRAAVDALYARVVDRPTATDVRTSCAIFQLRLALWKQDARAVQFLQSLSSGPCRQPDEAHAVIVACRDLIRHRGEGMTLEEKRRIQEFGFTFLHDVVLAIHRETQRLQSLYPDRKYDEWSASDVNTLRCLHQTAHTVAGQVYFASGAYAEGAQPSDSERAQFLARGVALLDSLSEIPFAEAAYDVLQTLEYFITCDPRRVLVLVATLIRRAAADGIQYESLAAGLVVRIVERYLAEYAALFRMDTEAKTALLDILDVFVAAGWPSATRLTYRLGEVFR